MIFKCRNCGGNTVYNPDKGSMYCPHCESIDSHDEMLGRGMEQCGNCGAPLEIQKYTSASKCPYCGMYLIFEERMEEKFKPKFVLPFKISKQKAIEVMKSQYKKKTFLPNDFLSVATIEAMEGTYVPFWLYDFDTRYHYKGKGTKVRTWRRGDVEYTETSFYDVVRELDIAFDKVPVDASIAMEDGIMDLMEPYEYKECEKFNPKYVSGFYSEIYNMEAEELEGRAKEKSRKDASELTAQTIQGYVTVVPQHEECQFVNVQQNYALLPVWQYSFNYKGEKFTYHVNGQTGKLIGNAPLATQRLIGYSVSCFGLLMAIGTLIKWIMEVM
ncbi:MAG: hypothetical protein R3Y24_12445 [Eubacteriales bacterium]